MARTHRNALQPGFEILWYRIESILGQGGFGITYLATDTKLDQSVAIKEYMPLDLASREGDSSVMPVTDEREEAFEWGRTRFLEEAKTLVKFKHRNTVRVLFYTEANNTGYMVMEYEEGQALDARLRREEPFDEEALFDTFLPLLDGLSVVHEAGFIHRDIKPANIFIRNDGSPVLLDFGAARQAMAGHTRTLTAVVSPGYAPFEQYASSGEKQGPWTDIYAMGATMYHAVVGRAPPDAITRSAIMHEEPDPLPPATQAEREGFSQEVLASIDRALAFRDTDRPQTVNEWRDMLTGAKPAFDNPSRTKTELQAHQSTWGMWLGVASITLVFAAGAFYFTAYVMPRDELELPARSISNESSAQLSGLSEESTAIDEVIQPLETTAVVDEESAALEAKTKMAVAQAEEAARQQDALVQDLLAQARADFDAGRFIGARERFAVVLSMQPDNTTAVAGHEKLFVGYLELAVTALETQQFSLARQHLNDAELLSLYPERVAAARTEVDAASVQWERAENERVKAQETEQKLQAELERLRAEQAAREQAEQDNQVGEVKSLLAKAGEHLAALRLTSPAGANAFDSYVSVLKLEPDNAQSVAGLEEISRRYAGLATLGCQRRSIRQGRCVSQSRD